MALNVSSDFYFKINQTVVTSVDRTFFIGSNDYSDRVTKWPKFKEDWNAVKAQTISVRMANQDEGLQNITLNKTHFFNADVILGFSAMTSSGVETVTVFQGKLDNVSFSRGDCTIKATDKLRQLAERIVGTQDSAVQMTNTIPSDIAWNLCTSFGGYSAIASTSNPDIDYTSFLNWAETFSQNSVLMSGYFEGEKVNNLLKRMSRLTDSAIFIKENKLTFNQYSQSETPQLLLNDGNQNLIEASLNFDMHDLINKQYVFANYDVDSDYHLITTIDEDSASVNSYGLKESKLDDNRLWYVDSISAVTMAQRLVRNKGVEPYDRIKVTAPGVGFIYNVGDTLDVSMPEAGISGKAVRIMGRNFDMESMKNQFDVDNHQILPSFQLDISALDSSDLLL